MKISVVVPAFNEAKLLPSSLRAIKEAAAGFEAAGWEWELVVCDNNSTDSTAEVAKSEGAQVVFEPINQISRARNRGASVATGDWLVFIDADSYPSSELFGDIVRAIETGQYLGGGSTVRMEGLRFWARWLTRFWNKISRSKRWVAGSCVFCKAEAFRALGGFSHELFAAEEIDFSERLKRLAALRQQEVIILQKHPLLTSARKTELYTLRDHFTLLGSTLIRRGRNLREKANCGLWYDGRR
jgi:glycosyltransferase involved in cell wall biosynthesis